MLSKVLLGAVAAGVAGVTTPVVVMAATGGSQHASQQPAMTAGASMRGSGGSDGGRAHVILRNAQGDQIGYVNLTDDRGTTLVSVRASGLTPGFHGFHVHSVGVCNPAGPVPFESAGGHFNPTGTAEGMQAGAFPVLLAGQDGTATASFRDDNFSLNQLFGPSGSSIVIHAMPDNYANIPSRYTSGGAPGPDMETRMTGDGGTRVACGIIAAPGPSGSMSASPAMPMPASPAMPMQAPSQPPTIPAPAPSQPTPATSDSQPAQPTPTPTDTVTTPPTASPGPTHF
jgi:superoxide dismutase, Cu-Zn family